jgi:hypothetical protein
MKVRLGFVSNSSSSSVVLVGVRLSRAELCSIAGIDPDDADSLDEYVEVVQEVDIVSDDDDFLVGHCVSYSDDSECVNEHDFDAIINSRQLKWLRERTDKPIQLIEGALRL